MGIGLRRLVAAVPLIMLTLTSVSEAAQVDCRRAPHQIGDFLARFKLTASGKPQQAMTVDALRIATADAPNVPIGWLFIDQYGNRWIQVPTPGRVQFNNTTPAFRAAVQVTGAAQYMPATVTLSVPNMVLNRCDRVSAP